MSPNAPTQGIPPETCALYVCIVPHLDGTVHSLQVDRNWVRPFIIAASVGGGLEQARRCLEEALRVNFVIMISDNLGYVGFGSEVAALEVEEDLSGSDSAIQFLSQDRWKQKLRQCYLERESVTEAIAHSEADLADIRTRLLHAESTDRQILLYHQAVTERGLKNLEKARDCFVTPSESQAGALHAMLDDPLPNLLCQSIEYAARLYDTGDPMMCDPNRRFAVIFLNGNIIGGSYNFLEFDTSGIDLGGGSLWVEEGFCNAITEDSHISIEADGSGHW